ncbi:MAG TPA: methyltransferase domain-containing protein [Chitinophagaceae bacterium]|nr:methyltransferase domain-containing protein [Chitinophagaceae bacterium]
MSRFHSYLNSATTILSLYKGEEPFVSFLKKYFAQNKKYGSKDRKQIGHLSYCYLRLGKSLQRMSTEEKILAGLFLCSTGPNEILKELRPQWDDKIRLTTEEKIQVIDSPSSLLDVFPWINELSEGIDHKTFCSSFLVQPDLFLRLRPGREEIVYKKFESAGITFRKISDSCLALNNSEKIDKIIELDKEAVVQDYSSQETGNLIKSEILNLKSEIDVWDCCAGSGGKSIMMYDINPQIQLTVSDKRESILANLKKRFQKAGLKNYKSFIADLSHDLWMRTHDFDFIIADVPCTGSGTWSRTPEQLYFFKPEKINEYAAMQQKILSNVIPHLKPDGYLIYITCSVFRKENEDAVTFIKDRFKLDLLKTELLKGYEQKTDSMFIAIFKKPL